MDLSNGILIKKTREAFLSKFLSNPIMVVSPGRVNLMGDHTDYNEGFVLPAAIDKVISLAVGHNNTRIVRAFSIDMNEYVEIDLNQETVEQEYHWAKYLSGVIFELKKKGIKIEGFDLVFGGNIPIGAGLSSSAALEGGILLGIKKLFGFELSKIEMAKIGQLTEHNHVGVRCGIMDQFINIHGEKGSALKLDCKSLDYELVPFDLEDLRIVLCNSLVTHNLASSEYNIRRNQCEEGIKVLRKYIPSIQSLRDVSLELLEEFKDELSAISYQRCKFVLEENQRVIDGCKALEVGDIASFGKLMFASHEGLSKDYKVSCEELDILIEIAKELPGLVGARMMGGGFGGCTINLVNKNLVNDFSNSISEQYKERTGIDTEIYITKVGEGVHLGDEY